MEDRKKFELVTGTILALVFAAILLLALMAGGCSEVQMSPAYRQNLEMTNIAVQELNNRCAGGDPNACRNGLAESAKYLRKLVHAVNGTTEGGQQQ